MSDGRAPTPGVGVDVVRALRTMGGAAIGRSSTLYGPCRSTVSATGATSGMAGSTLHIGRVRRWGAGCVGALTHLPSVSGARRWPGRPRPHRPTRYRADLPVRRRRTDTTACAQDASPLTAGRGQFCQRVGRGMFSRVGYRRGVQARRPRQRPRSCVWGVEGRSGGSGGRGRRTGPAQAVAHGTTRLRSATITRSPGQGHPHPARPRTTGRSATAGADEAVPVVIMGCLSLLCGGWSSILYSTVGDRQ